MSLTFYAARTEELHAEPALGSDALLLEEALARVLPPQISDLHLSLANWGKLNRSPGVMNPERIWVDGACEVYFAFDSEATPQPLMQTALAAEIAAWLVLLDRWMETYVVVARARSVWTTDELAGALTFMTPAFLPPTVVKVNPNWDRVAAAIALAVADGPLAGDHADKHWRSKSSSDSSEESKRHSPKWQTSFQRKSG